eukprot:TRINITY_DN64269_c0_g1_i1.p1 TRINITY_DN64269_c0_g1~~TRINITY_DN64269_c0_g1_i1.p1  ORF type:complete len:889 (-),score=108.46 TRINITY_DN64269_c0_g1_i1:398-3064(-)
MEEYEKLYRLGSGGQGKILKVKHKRTGVPYACKMILCRDNYEMNFALKEIKMLMDLKHKHIIGYKDFFIHKDRYEDLYVCLVMELCEHGDLSEKIREMKRKHMKFDERRIIKWMIQMCSALHYIHENDILHRDLKPTNVFFTAKDDIKIGDFGLSTAISANGRRTIVGTPYYFSPELMLQQKYNSKVDMWGLGIVMMELATLKERPVNSQVLNNPKVLDEIECEIRITNGYNAALAVVTKEMLQKNPERRPTARSILLRFATEDELHKMGLLTKKQPSPGMLCEMCSETVAKFKCLECEEAFCELCDLKQHRAQKRVNHKRTPLAKIESGDHLCEHCGQCAATVSCSECEEAFCTECDNVRHKSQKRANHVRNPLKSAVQNYNNNKRQPQPTQHHRDGRTNGNQRPRAYAIEPTPQPITKLNLDDVHPDGQQPHTARIARNLPLAPVRAIGSARGMQGATPTPMPFNPAVTTGNVKHKQVENKSAFVGDDKENVNPNVNQNDKEEGPAFKVKRSMSIGVNQTHRVPKDFNSIAAAVKAASQGDRIIVAAGVYKDPLTIDKVVTIIGEEGVSIEVDGKTAITVTATHGKLENLHIRQLKVIPAAGDEQPATSEGKFVGIDIRNGSCKLERCDIVSNSGACIAIHKNADPLIQHCLIHDGKQAGVYIFDEGRGTLVNNDIFNNEYAGVLLKRGGNPVVRKNKIRNGKDTGIFICHESWGNIDDNEIFNNNGSGIVIKGGGAPTITKNNIHNNHQAGIFCCDKGRGRISENVIHANVKAGVLIKTKGNPSLSKNLIYAGIETGVYVFEHGEGTIEENEIYENQNAGVLVTTGGHPRLLGNRITKNKYEGVWICKRGEAFLEGNDLRFNQKGPIDIDPACVVNVQMVQNITN